MISQLTAARAFTFLAFALLVAVLNGCDNAVVNVTDSRWKTVAMDTAQLPASERIPTTLITEGNGTVVNAGDLVKMRIGDGRRRGDGTEWAQDAWYWTGYLPADLYHYGATAPTIFGGLLVGRRVARNSWWSRRKRIPTPRCASPGWPSRIQTGRGAGIWSRSMILPLPGTSLRCASRRSRSSPVAP